MVIKRVCAWCSRYLGSKECESLPQQSIEELVSHSICPECLKKEIAEINAISINNTKE